MTVKVVFSSLIETAEVYLVNFVFMLHILSINKPLIMCESWCSDIIWISAEEA